jgi:hypothetical protein
MGGGVSVLKKPRSYTQNYVYVSPELERVHVLFSHKYDEDDKEFLRHWKRLHLDRVPPHRLAPLSENAEFSGTTVFRFLDEFGLNQPAVFKPEITCQAGYRRDCHLIWWTYTTHKDYLNPTVALSHQQWLAMVQCRERLRRGSS